MHVAQFVHRYPPAIGGAEAWAARLGRHLHGIGHPVSVFTTTALDQSAFRKLGQLELPPGMTVEDGIMVHRFRPSFRFPGRRYLLKAASFVPVRSWQSMLVPWAPISRDLWREAGTSSVNVDVVHAIAFPHAPIVRSALRMARQKQVPFVVTPFLHLGDPDDPRDRIRKAYTAPHLRWLLRHADRVLVQTPTERQAVVEMGIADDQIVLQGLGVDSADCTGGLRDATRTRWGVTPTDIVVGHLAHLSHEKGTVDLVQAVDRLNQAGRGVQVVLAGPTMPSFTKFRQRSGPYDWLHVLGQLSESERRHFFAAIDLFVLPSRSDSFGLVFLEAWANAIPVVGYRAGGVADVIRTGRDGILVPCGNIDGLADAIRTLATDAAMRQKLGATGKDRIDRDFRWHDKLERATMALTDWP